MAIGCGLGLCAEDDFVIDQYQIGVSGGASAGEEFSLSGTIGESTAGGPLSGGEFTVTGGLGAYQVLQTEGAPTLTLTVGATGAAVVAWPSPSSGWALRHIIDLASDSPWATPPEKVQDDGTLRYIVIDQPAGTRFFRLEPVSATVDTDGDGITDAFELAHGFNPNDPDENRNGIPDGQEDVDGDGLSNQVEETLGLDPRAIATFPPTRDDQLDRDHDYLTDVNELLVYHTDWLKNDTDGDGYSDDSEVLMKTNPTDPRSHPVPWTGTRTDEVFVRRVVGTAAPAMLVGRGAEVFVAGKATNAAPQFTIGQPPVDVYAPGRSSTSVPPFILGQPPIETTDQR